MPPEVGTGLQLWCHSGLSPRHEATLSHAPVPVYMRGHCSSVMSSLLPPPMRWDFCSPSASSNPRTEEMRGGNRPFSRAHLSLSSKHNPEPSWGGARMWTRVTLLGDPFAACAPATPPEHGFSFLLTAGQNQGGNYRFVPRMEPPCPVQPPTSDQPISFI